MAALSMEIRRNEKAEQPLFPVDIGVRDALRHYAKLRWPDHTAKMAAREWDLSLDEARGLTLGRTSLATLDKIIKHRNGGLAVLISLGSAITGQSVHQFFEEQQKRARHERERYAASVARFGEMARDLPSLLAVDLGSAAGRDRMGRKRAQ